MRGCGGLRRWSKEGEELEVFFWCFLLDWELQANDGN